MEVLAQSYPQSESLPIIKSFLLQAQWCFCKKRDGYNDGSRFIRIQDRDVERE